MAGKPVVGPPNPFLRDFPTQELPAGTVLHRVHDSAYSANEANPTEAQYRFSPLYDLKNQRVPTLYAGETQQCAFMETVFRQVVDGTKSIRASKLKGRAYSALRLRRKLRLARLDGVGLTFFRVEQQQVTATTCHFYPLTARWCEAFYRADPKIDGLLWVSHRATPKLAFLLFGTNVPASDLEIVSGPTPLLTDSTLWQALKTAADEIRVRIPEFAGLPP